MTTGTHPMPGIDPCTAFRLLSDNIQQVIQGKPAVVRLAIATLFAKGHLLIEDYPGLGKTTLARALAASVNGLFSRIQFTPDLLPGEITGAQVYQRDTGTFRFHQGPVFANVVLADEINRGTPKTQSALLEVMAEGTVSVDGVRHEVPTPFMVVATQNPIEMEGTYRLPEAQLDRFLMRVKVDYPDPEAEVRVVLNNNTEHFKLLRPVIDLHQLTAVTEAVQRVHVDPALARYAVDMTTITRRTQGVTVGASPRGTVALVRAAQAWAATEGRHAITPDDLRVVAHPVLDHRVIMGPEAEFSGQTAAQVVNRALLGVDDAKVHADAAGRR